MDNFSFREAIEQDQEVIWNILQQAIERRRLDGSSQWQDGYPNPETVKSDIDRKIGYVLCLDDEVVAYGAVIMNDEPAYENIEGDWLSNADFLVVHRVAVSEKVIGRGLAQKLFENIEKVALEKEVFSIKVDTNFDNGAMLYILKKLNYVYCGEVYFRGSPRKAFEKLLYR